MGVWIETVVRTLGKRAKPVTPFVGVWIETIKAGVEQLETQVTPFVGVWIETERFREIQRFRESHTLRGCVD